MFTFQWFDKHISDLRNQQQKQLNANLTFENRISPFDRAHNDFLSSYFLLTFYSNCGSKVFNLLKFVYYHQEEDNGMPIKQVRSAKFLGVYLDDHLTWSDHVKTVIGKISKTCGILNKLKYRLPQSILLNTLILPYLQYNGICLLEIYVN